jgi:3-phosphoshikimate 1-carboxyvinyltransferase
MDELELVPLTTPVNHTVSVPGSKSLSNRALILMALQGGGTITGLLHSEDTEVMIDSLRKLGFTVEVRDNAVTVARPAGAALIPNNQADLFIANSGTSVRFLAAAVSLGQGTYTLDGIPRMRERPIGDLLDALKQAGVETTCPTGCPPVTITTQGWTKHTLTVRADISSQYLSALLMAAPFAGKQVTINVTGAVVSEPYIDMTVRQMQSLGHRVDQRTAGVYVVQAFHRRSTLRVESVSEPDSESRATINHYAIEPDASSASYFFAAAAVTGGTITVRGTHAEMMQGDIGFTLALEEMGCVLTELSDGYSVTGQKLRGIDIDMNEISDTMMTLAAVACFADGPTTIRNVAHVRHKETDRITAMATELRKLGIRVEEFADGLTIHPGPMHGAHIDTYNDHRMAMSLAVVGLVQPGVVIRNPGCVAKTYPSFWNDWAALSVSS